MKARLLFRDKYIYGGGAIREMVNWRLSEPNTERPHSLKYRLYYGQSRRCLVRFDNERGKGDHRHYTDRQGRPYEENYSWISVQQLITDFRADIERIRGTRDE